MFSACLVYVYIPKELSGFEFFLFTIVVFIGQGQNLVCVIFIKNTLYAESSVLFRGKRL